MSKFLASSGLSRSVKFFRPYFWLWTNDSKTNLVAFCRSILVYIPGKFGAKVEARAGEAVGIEIGISLFLIKVLWASSFLLARGGL